MKIEASNKFQLFGKNKNLIVINSHNNTYQKYNVHNTMDTNGDPIKKTTLRTVTQEEASAINSLFLFKNELNNNLSNSNSVRKSSTSNFDYILSYNIKIDPYDFAAHDPIRRDVFNNLKNDYFFMPMTLAQKAVDILQIPTNFDIGIILTVNFYSDSGTLLGNAKLTINPLYSGFNVVEIVDEEGNVIPDHVNQINGKSFRVREGNHYEKFYNFMNNKFEIRWTGETGGGFCTVSSVKQVGDRFFYSFKCS